MSERRLVLDSHVHFWNPSIMHYPWLKAAPALRRAFLPRDLDSLSARTVDGVVFVEANAVSAECLREVEFVEALARDEPRLLGIVANVDLLDEAGRTVMFEALATHDRVVGIRHNIQGHPAGYCRRRAFVAGVKAATRHGFTFDLCITADQLPDAIRLVQRCPDTRFVLDHCGKPAIRAGAMEPWAANIAALAACENVVCKVSGLLTEAAHEQRTIGALRPYLDHVQASFGVERLLYGSDWPMLTSAGGTTLWRDIANEFTAGWSDRERDGFYAANAIRTYGLEVA